MPEKPTRKAGLEVCGWQLCPFKLGKETHLQAKAYLYVSHLEACLAYFSYRVGQYFNITA